MKIQSSMSICSVVDGSYHDHTKHLHSQPPTLNQTSIRNFFVKSASARKRPVSAASTTDISIQYSDDASQSPSPVLTKGNDISCSVNVTLDSYACQPLHDFTKSYTNTDKRLKLSSTTSLLGVTTQKPKSTQSKQQLYIDFGQRNFAATNICPVCGMLYVHGVQSDIKQHEKICHNYQHGVLWSSATSVPKKSISADHPNANKQPHQKQRVCYEWTLPKTKGKTYESIAKYLPSSTTHNRLNNIYGSNRTSDDLIRAHIVEVRNGNCCLVRFEIQMFGSGQNTRRLVLISNIPFTCTKVRPNKNGAYNMKVKLIRMIVDQELGFAPRTGNDVTTTTNEPVAYICVVNKRAVGLVLVEEITTAYPILDNSPTLSLSTSKLDTANQLKFGLTRSHQTSRAVLGIYQIWVHDKHRRRGIASTLVDVARKHMYFGYSAIPVDQIAFSSPTEAGLAFAKLYNMRNHNNKDVLVYDCC